MPAAHVGDRPKPTDVNDVCLCPMKLKHGMGLGLKLTEIATCIWEWGGKRAGVVHLLHSRGFCMPF